MRTLLPVALLLLTRALTSPGQPYFNQRLHLLPAQSGAATVLPTADGGCWVAGGGYRTPAATERVLLLQHLDAQAQADQPLKSWSQPDRFYYACFGNSLLALPDGGMLLIADTQGGASRSGPARTSATCPPARSSSAAAAGCPTAASR